MIKEIRGKILHQIAYIESALDDPEHYEYRRLRQKSLDQIVDNGIKKDRKTACDSRRWKAFKRRDQYGDRWKAECRQVFAFEFACRKRARDRDGRRGNDQRCAGGADQFKWDQFKYHRYGGNP